MPFERVYTRLLLCQKEGNKWSWQRFQNQIQTHIQNIFRLPRLIMTVSLSLALKVVVAIGVQSKKCYMSVKYYNSNIWGPASHCGTKWFLREMYQVASGIQYWASIIHETYTGYHRMMDDDADIASPTNLKMKSYAIFIRLAAGHSHYSWNIGCVWQVVIEYA